MPVELLAKLLMIKLTDNLKVKNTTEKVIKIKKMAYWELLKDTKGTQTETFI